MRTITDKNHRAIALLDAEQHIKTQVDPLLVSRKKQLKSEGALGFYRHKIALFADYCDAQRITAITQLTPTIIRNFIFWFQQQDYNKSH